MSLTKDSTSPKYTSQRIPFCTLTTDDWAGRSASEQLHRSHICRCSLHGRTTAGLQASPSVPGARSMAGSAGQCSGVMNDRNACSKTMQMHSCPARVRSALRVHDHCSGKSRRDHEDASTLAGRLAGRSSAPMSRASRVARGGGSKGSNPQFEVMGSECMNQAG